MSSSNTTAPRTVEKRPRSPSPDTGEIPRASKAPLLLLKVTGLDALVVAFQQCPMIMKMVAHKLVFTSNAVRIELLNSGQPFVLAPDRRIFDEHRLSFGLTCFANSWAPQVTTLDLREQVLSHPVAGGYVQLLQRMPNLEQLGLRFEVNVGGQAGHFVELANTRFRNMKVLDLRQCRFESDEVTAVLRSLSECTGLRALHLDHSNLDGHAEDLAAIFNRNRALSGVSFDCCFRQPDNGAIQQIANALPTSLMSFVLGDHYGFRPEDWAAVLNKLAACPNLVTVDFENAIHANVDSRKMRQFRARLGELQTVRNLSLSRWTLDREGTYGPVTLWETLATMRNLRKLDLTACNMRAVFFAEDLRLLPLLKELILKNNRITSDSTRAFAMSWSVVFPGHVLVQPLWPSLEVLDLRYNQIGYYGIHHFMTQIHRMPRMRILEMAQHGEFQYNIDTGLQYARDNITGPDYQIEAVFDPSGNRTRVLRRVGYPVEVRV